MVGKKEEEEEEPLEGLRKEPAGSSRANYGSQAALTPFWGTPAASSLYHL